MLPLLWLVQENASAISPPRLSSGWDAFGRGCLPCPGGRLLLLDVPHESRQAGASFASARACRACCVGADDVLAQLKDRLGTSVPGETTPGGELTRDRGRVPVRLRDRAHGAARRTVRRTSECGSARDAFCEGASGSPLGRSSSRTFSVDRRTGALHAVQEPGGDVVGRVRCGRRLLAAKEGAVR